MLPSLKATCLVLAILFSMSFAVEIQTVTAEDQAETLGNIQVHEIASVNWTRFWNLFNARSAWDLEYNDGGGWFSVKSDLAVTKNYTNAWTCKITLNFTASHTADYRLTFGIDVKVSNYVVREDRFQYVLTYQDYTVRFDWSDIAQIPNIITSHGVKTIDGDRYFWFRAQRNNVPEGANVIIDPTFGFDESGIVQCSYPNFVYGYRVSCPEYGTVKNMSVYVEQDDTNKKLKLAIYKLEDNSLVAYTDEWTVTAGFKNWKTLNVAWGGAVEPTDYYLAWWQNGANIIYGNEFADYESQLNYYAYDGFPDPVSWIPSTKNEQFSLYATYVRSEINITASYFTLFLNNTDGNDITSVLWTENDVLRRLQFTTTGNCYINVGDYGKPLRIIVDGEQYSDWTYDGTLNRVTINNLSSDVAVYFSTPQQEPTGTTGVQYEPPEEPPPITLPKITIPKWGYVLIIGTVAVIAVGSIVSWSPAKPPKPKGVQHKTRRPPKRNLKPRRPARLPKRSKKTGRFT